MELVFNERWKGCVVELKLRNRSPVTGTVVLVGKSALTLKDVASDGNHLPKARFEKHDITSVNIVVPFDTASSDSSVQSSPEKFRANDLSRKVSLRERAVQEKEEPAHLRGMRNSIEIDILTNRVPMPAPPVNGTLGGGEPALPEFNADYVVIDVVGEALLQAVDYISGLTEIAVSVIGENVTSRFGTPILLNIAAGEYVFIFDLLALGIAAFNSGEGTTLRDILESEGVTKVIHNCQGMADILKSLYGVNLQKVDDTMAFAASEFYIREGSFSKFAVGLPHILTQVLKIPSSHIFFPRARHGMNDETIWRQRPLPEHLLLNACKTVVHLPHLRDALISLHLTRARQGSEILLNYMRGKEDDEAAMSCIDVPSLLPLDFLKLDDLRCKPPSGRKFSDRVEGGSADPYVHFTRDTQKQCQPNRALNFR